MFHVLLVSALGFLGTAEAHPGHHAHRGGGHAHKSAIEGRRTAPVASVSWTWVNGHWKGRVWIRDHWRHPQVGVSYRAKHVGPPPRRPHAHAHWVPGHWEWRGPRRVWVSGRWVVR